MPMAVCRAVQSLARTDAVKERWAATYASKQEISADIAAERA